MTAKPASIRTEHGLLAPLRGPREDGAYYWKLRFRDEQGRPHDIGIGWAPHKATQATLEPMIQTALAYRGDTVARLLRAWLDHLPKRGVSVGTEHGYLARCSTIMHRVGTMEIGKVGGSLVEYYEAVRRIDGVAETTLLNELKVLSMALRWASGTPRYAGAKLRPLGRCVECGRDAECRHHVIPRSSGGKFTIALCRACHGRAHDHDRIELVRKGRAVVA